MDRISLALDRETDWRANCEHENEISGSIKCGNFLAN